jgi:hypothetical protein
VTSIGVPTTAAEGARRADRPCGRCRELFPADPTLYEPGGPGWWLCDACRQILIPTGMGRPTVLRSQRRPAREGRDRLG